MTTEYYRVSLHSFFPFLQAALATCAAKYFITDKDTAAKEIRESWSKHKAMKFDKYCEISKFMK